ncbi:MAG TPA: translin family protein [Thermoplasmata archaeon]
MKSLDKIVSAIENELDEKDQIREAAIKSSRNIIRLCGNITRSLHRNERSGSDLSELARRVSALRRLVKGHPEIEYAGYVQSALQEYAEARILTYLLDEGDVPSPRAVGVGGVPYMLGLADCVGELRRFALNQLKSGDVDKANISLEQMEDIYSAMMRFDYPDAIIAMRHKQDVSRSLLEKTRGEVAIAATAKNLTDKLEAGLRRS